MPRIGNYRAALEAQASRAIGVPVRIGSITAESAGLFPSFELREVVLFDAQQREALRLARVVASVSPRSLFRFSFEQLYLQGPELEVRRDKLGKLHVAGLDMSTDTTGEKRGADWFFAQREFVIEGGKVRWTDEGSGADPLMLTDVTLIARNGGRRHAMRLDATPPEGWGERFTLRGQFRQPLLSVRSGNWQSWDGQVYADLPGFDVSRLGRYAALDARIREGNGAVRVWADVSHGQWVGGAVDLALARVDTTLGDAAAPLMLRGLSGRVAGRLTGKTLEVSTRGLQFESADGTRWPGGDFWLQHTPQQGRTPERGAFKADRLDLGVLALIAHRLPLGQATHKALADFAPRGLVDRIDATWQGSLGAPDRYQAKGRASGLQLASQPAAGTGGAGTGKTPAVGRPGVRGLTIDFDATQAGGKATLSMAQGALDFPGVFEEPVIPVDQLAGSLQWQLDGAKAQVQVANLRFANADAQGEAQIGWRTSDPALRGGARYPGVLDLQGKLTRADGARVFRYLPQDIGKDVRDYVRDSVVKGSASSVDFRVRGDLVDMPFTDPRRGDFRIAARVADVTYAFVPPERGSAVPSHWPTLTALAGELVFERAGMQVRNARGRIVGAPGVEVGKAEAQIADMAHAALLQLDVQAKGALGELLQLAVPLAGAASDAAGQARAAGSADYRLKLALPLAAMDKAKVQASIAFGGNDLQVAPEAPPFTQLRGTLNFTESGFTLVGGQARLVGGDVRVEGRGRYAGTGHDMSFSGQGTATAEGLRGARQVDWLARLARKATGSAPYAASFALRDGASEFSLSSSLQGLALQLPAPLTKPADEALPLRIEKKVVQREARAGAAPLLNDQLSLELGRIVTARYDRDISGNEPRVLRGGVGVGLAPGETAAPPARGVLANVNLARIDVDAWQALFNETTGAAPEVPASGAAAPAADEAQGYLPSVVALRAQELRVSGRKLSNVVVGGSREGNLWRGNIDATELSGYVEYRQAQAGRIYARLARLKIAPSETTEVESLLDAQPATLPALDIVVDDFELLGKRLGKLEIGAVNRGGAEREWQLDKLNLSTPEASFSARGSWATAPSGRPRAGQRRTAMAFKLDMTDAGALLARLGMKDVVARGRGRMEGDVEWRGSPFSLDYPSMSGQLNVNVEQGQFLKAEPGIAKLLGVLSLQALPRRLTLDFRDVFSTGFAFDFVRGDAKIVDGTATTNNLQMKGVNAAVLMDGSANLAKETQDLHVVVVPEINAGTASLVATAINPAIGLGTFLAQMVLRRPLIAAATQEFRVDGTWADPKVTRMPRRPAVAAPLPPTARDDPKTETTQ